MKNIVRTLLCVLFIVGVSACSKIETAKNSTGCIADSLGNLGDLSADLPNCKDDVMHCRDACADGDALSCLSAAHAMEAANGSEVVYTNLFRQGCVLGVASACTNYAAGIWANEPSPKELVCARQVFEKACTAKDHFACGMRAHIAFASDSTADKEIAKKRIEDDCAALGGFPCRVLARHLEKGEFGSHDESEQKLLLEKACRGGDDDARGEHSTVADTFH